MHRALHIPEILHLISGHTDGASLPALALTCRAFQGPALDALWRHLPSIEPFIRCLPKDLWGFNLQGELILLKPIDAEAWATFRKYASRVRSIAQSEDPFPIIKHLRILMLSYPYPSLSMFPNLRSQTHHAIEFLRMAFVPSLVSLDLRITSISPAFMSILSTVGTTCPNLTSFRPRVEDPTMNYDISPFLTQSICQLHHLCGLSVSGLGDRGMVHVAQLKSLKTLWLYIDPFLLRGLPPQPLGLEHLDLLGLQGIRLDHMTAFLRSLRTVRTKRITVVFCSTLFAQQSNSVSHLCAMLQEKCDNDTLEAITLCERFYNNFDNSTAQPSDFSPLSHLRNLTHFDVEAGCTISISDDELRELVNSWPKLRIFRLSCYHNCANTTLPTFHGLINLLKLCPELVSLSLVIDTTHLTGIDLKSLRNGVCNNRLQELVLGNSPIDSVPTVALILNSLFPNLKEVNLGPWRSGPLYSLTDKTRKIDQWKSVNRLLGAA
ncbi:hypothetical protein DFH29DRAFT_964674 [Suillus ampliporus]|nr:hypothetical protein DFH29DRAFT_964674 [Suillus ampliporus]